MHMRSISVVALLLGAAPSAAADWRFLDRWEPVGAFPALTTEYDAQTLRLKDSTVTVWKKDTFDTPAVLVDGTPAVASISRQIKFDCAERTAQILAQIFNGERGDLVASDYEPGFIKPIPPDSVGESELVALCALAAAQ